VHENISADIYNGSDDAVTTGATLSRCLHAPRSFKASPISRIHFPFSGGGAFSPIWWPRRACACRKPWKHRTRRFLAAPGIRIPAPGLGPISWPRPYRGHLHRGFAATRRNLQGDECRTPPGNSERSSHRNLHTHPFSDPENRESSQIQLSTTRFHPGSARVRDDQRIQQLLLFATRNNYTSA